MQNQNTKINWKVLWLFTCEKSIWFRSFAKVICCSVKVNTKSEPSVDFVNDKVRASEWIFQFAKERNQNKNKQKIQRKMSIPNGKAQQKTTSKAPEQQNHLPFPQTNSWMNGERRSTFFCYFSHSIHFVANANVQIADSKPTTIHAKN